MESQTLNKKKFSVKNFFSKFDQIHRKLVILSYLLKKALVENFFFMQINSDEFRRSKNVF